MAWLRRAFRLVPDEPGTVEDPVHGPVLVTPVHPDGPPAPYRVASPALGELELSDRDDEVRTPAFTGRVRRSHAIGRRAHDDVRVQWDGHELHLKQTRRKRAKLRLDGTTVARLERVQQHRADLDRFRTRYTISWEQPVEPSVALLGHALASRYGVGAPGAFLRFLDTFSSASF